jgi:hypothetical protein
VKRSAVFNFTDHRYVFVTNSFLAVLFFKKRYIFSKNTTI